MGVIWKVKTLQNVWHCKTTKPNGADVHYLNQNKFQTLFDIFSRCQYRKHTVTRASGDKGWR